MRALALAALLLAAPVAAAADTCELQLGHGWPPATESHGSAVEQLFGAGEAPVLSLTRLPERGKESGVMLFPATGGEDWLLRSATADDRVSSWSTAGGTRSRTLNVDQTPKLREVPMPAALATRLLDSWQRALQVTVPADTAAGVHEGDVLLFVVGDRRVSGPAPACGPSLLLVAQAALLVEASDTGDKRRDKRWRALERSLDELQEQLATAR